MGIQAIGGSSMVDLTSRAQSAANASANKSAPSAPAKTGGTPPPSGGGGAKPAGASSTSSTSSSTSSNKIYDKRDLNQDGTVTYEEMMQYALQHSSEESQDQSTVSTSQMQSGLNAYKQNQQANDSSTSSLLTSA
jgi:hypothetical protein